MDAGGAAGAERDVKDLRVLILTPQGRDAALAAQTLSRSGLISHVCADLGALRREIEIGAGAALIAEEALDSMDAGKRDAFFDSGQPWSSLPMVVLLGRSAPPRHYATLRWLERRPNVSFLERPVPKRALVSALRAALEARRLQYAIRDSLDAAETASRKKDEFLATLAHELRNPMAPIRSAVYVLRKLNSDDAASTNKAKASVVIAMVERQVDHLVRLVDDLLEVSRVTTGKITLKKQYVYLADIIKQAVEISQPLVESGQHELVVSAGDEPLAVDGDPVRLVQVFANLINNAAKYTSPCGRIEISLRRGAENAVIHVGDNGMGILAGMLPHVFELFSQSYRAKGHDQGGLGIGLALVRSLVEMHGGRVEAHSEGAGKGSDFVVHLPLVTACERTEAHATASKGPPLGRVLVVDDDKDVADSLAMLLETMGAEARVAYSGLEAVSDIASFKPRIAFVDLGMPAMDGYETALRLRSASQGKDIVLVALSGWGSEADRRRALQAGFNYHFVKPISFETLKGVFA
jgi:signal transduction histidine kinase